MTDHKTGTREEWLAARLELLDAEKELTRRGDELARQRQELPWVRIDKEYRFETDDGTASLVDLFRGEIARPGIGVGRAHRVLGAHGNRSIVHTRRYRRPDPIPAGPGPLPCARIA